MKFDFRWNSLGEQKNRKIMGYPTDDYIYGHLLRDLPKDGTGDIEMYNEESIMNAIAPVVVMILEMLNKPVETMKASVDRLTVEIMELETKMENKINAAISEVEVSTDYDELRQELVDAVDTMNEELYDLRTNIENMETDVEQNLETSRNNNYTLTMIRDALNDNHDSI